ncbi:uncharacterized protein L969DRAFT_18129 [Mixia osmundae IAM 14324]|uniref:uncharacterized protein n=1 Tax=Mixia osmundae (strain CBS 9802 / IAM 14324 / JCM 22182 / KY 12970) TaxID=764103 RepID=UPI0004A55445|nr:uncharacterized protein L969DRAFT_18129 [Mixia osmundae IAM 14324]KEI39055.1 hypothetical protein L969DRAFT_18129 [Mixia osmundae IAM 14324]
MARDRLQAMRVRSDRFMFAASMRMIRMIQQGQGGGYGQPAAPPSQATYNAPQQSYPSQQPYYQQQQQQPQQPQQAYGGAAGGYDRRQQDQYDQPPPVQPTGRQNGASHEAYEMGHVNGSQPTMQGFFDEVFTLREALEKQLSANISEIDTLHSRILNATDDNASAQAHAQLQDVSRQTTSLTNNIKVRIQRLNDETNRMPPGGDQNTRRTQIVKPDATQEEVNAALSDPSAQSQIFSQALVNSNRYGDARAAYKETQTRNEDIKQIERTIGELAQLFNEMAMMIEQQDEQVKAVEVQAAGVETDMQNAGQQIHKGKLSAIAARKKRWICFIILLIILIIVAIVLAVHFTR